MSIPTKKVQKKLKSDHTVFKKQVNNKNSLNKQNSPAQDILNLHQNIGNRGVQRLFESGFIQGKLTVGEPNDKYEQEADRVADVVIRMPEPQVQRQSEKDEEEEMIQTKPIGDQITPLIQRQVEPEEEEEAEPEKEEEEMIQTKAKGQIPQVAPNFESKINALQGAGHSLPKETRNFFEPRFRQDFSSVKVHTDSNANQLARSINARAFTKGNNIVFGSGEYSPGSSNGKRLLGHELTHVVQQNSSSDSPGLERKILPAQSRESKKLKFTFKFKFNYTTSPYFGFEFLRAQALEIRIKKLLDSLKKRNRDFPVVVIKRLEFRILEHLDYLDEVFGLPIATGTKRQFYVYKIQVGFPGENVYSTKLVSPRLPIVKTPEQIAAEEAEKEMSPAERMKKVVENIDESLAKFDQWAEWAEFLSQDMETTNRISKMQKYLNKYRKPISNTLKVAEITKQAAQFVYQLENTMNHSPGTPEAAKAFSKLGKPVGDLLEAISKFELTPPGVKQFLEALAEAARGAPDLVEDVERAADPQERMRHRKDWWVVARPVKR